MILIRNLTLTFADRVLFDDINISLTLSDKIGLVGRNGAGKSTLLSVIAGKQYVDQGTVEKQGSLTIGYLPQEVILNSDTTVFQEAFSAFESLIATQKELHSIEQRLEKEHKNHAVAELMERYAQLQEQNKLFDAHTAQQKTTEVLQGLGFSEEKMQESVQHLSVGWQMRVLLARLLLCDADFYLFDEPTNHLDIVTKEWFLSFLQNASFGYLLVSHDRYFLDHACTKILELERGKAKFYEGNFTRYVVTKEREQERLKAAYLLQQKEIVRKQKTIDAFRATPSKAKMVQSMIKQLEKIEKIVLDPPLPNVHFSFPEVQRSGKIVLDVDNVAFSFEKTPLFSHVSFHLYRQQKGALIAANGVGKSTLLNCIVGNHHLQNGSITFGHNVQFAYFEQDQTKLLSANKTILQVVMDACPHVTEAKIRSFLGSFLFSGDDVHKKIGVLSGGEKNRVAMVIVLLQDTNLLLLDEPTNHLDIYAKEVLLKALQQYQGTILFVSHDREFIEKLANVIFELTSEGVETFEGDYKSFLFAKKFKNDEGEQKKSREISKSSAHDKTKDLNSDRKAVQKKIRSIESKIKKLEDEQNKLGSLLADHDYTSNIYQKALMQLNDIEKELTLLNQEWDALTDELLH